MMEFVGLGVAVLASFALGWAVRRGFSESTLHDDKELDSAYAQGVADERAASRNRQELAEVIDLKQQAPRTDFDLNALRRGLYTGHWPS